MRSWSFAGYVAGALACVAVLGTAPAARALDKVTTGGVGAPQATLWPFYIGMSKGFFSDAGVELDMIYAPTAPGILQQLAGGSLDIVASTGLPEPIHAIEKGAPVAVARIVGQVSPYAVMGKPEIKKFTDLKGKIFALGGLADISFVYHQRMLAATGMAKGDVDTIVIGSTGARLAALQSGAIDATILLPPYNFYAEKAGFHTINLIIDYVKDLPFTGLVVSIPWAKSHTATAQHLLSAYDKSVRWFYDDANRAEAIEILNNYVKLERENVVKSYDFYRKINFFAPSDKVSRASLESMIKAMRETGDVQGPLAAEKIIMSGLTALSD